MQQSNTSPSLETNPFLIKLVAENVIKMEEIPEILENLHTTHGLLITFLVQKKKCDAKKIAICLAAHLKLDFFDLSQMNLDAFITNVIETTLIKQYQILPLLIKNNQLYLAISEPTHTEHVAEIQFHTSLLIHPVVVELNKLTRLINQFLSATQYQSLSQQQHVSPIVSNMQDDRIISWVDQMLEDAIRKKASDIHIEPGKTDYRIRFRLDGILYPITQCSSEMGQRIIARLKIISRLDISERRLPQDGRFNIENSGASKDCRISVCPTLFGEKIVLRILDIENMSLRIAELGLDVPQEKIFLEAIQKPQGMILVTGPTGSGKTVTLYTALHFLNCSEKNICTVEDPIEITLSGINQVNVDPKIELSFSKILHTFLRQDPDVLMVGEIRDQETAETAVKAAQTGHLVFSTLHTNNAVETLTRLFMLGISPFNIAYSVQLIIAQRLVRKLCVDCKRPYLISISQFEKWYQPLNKSHKKDICVYESVGCDRCTKGYSGRMAIFECLAISSEISTLIAQEKPISQIIESAKKEGMMDLKSAAIHKIIEGKTSISEVKRVVL